MAVVQLINLIAQISDSSHYTACDRWDGYVCPTPRDFPEGPFQGYMLDWGGFYNTNTLGSFNNMGYPGYTTNFGGISLEQAIGSFTNQQYAGYTTNWGKYEEPIDSSLYDSALDTIIRHPKDQYVYYKLRGWNPLTSNYETWIVKHDITGQASLDGGVYDPDPGTQPPNIERDVFKTPPSGNTLENIIIAARWFE